MSGVRGDLIVLCFVFGEVCVVSWCCGGLVVCVRWPGVLHQSRVVWCGGWLLLGVELYMCVCARCLWYAILSCTLVIRMCVFVEEVCAYLCV